MIYKVYDFVKGEKYPKNKIERFPKEVERYFDTSITKVKKKSGKKTVEEVVIDDKNLLCKTSFNISFIIREN